jgi:hypothetical protein
MRIAFANVPGNDLSFSIYVRHVFVIPAYERVYLIESANGNVQSVHKAFTG